MVDFIVNNKIIMLDTSAGVRQCFCTKMVY